MKTTKTVKRRVRDLILFAHGNPNGFIYDDIYYTFSWTKNVFLATRREACADLTQGIKLGGGVNLAPGAFTIVAIPQGPYPWIYKLTADAKEIVLWETNRLKDARTRNQTMRDTAEPLRTHTDGRTRPGKSAIEVIIGLNAVDHELTSVGAAFAKALNSKNGKLKNGTL